MDVFNLKDKEVFVFDAFGTLFRTALIGSALKDIVGDASEFLVEIWRRKQLEYSWLRNQMGEYVPFNKITKDALEYAMNKVGLNDPKIFETLLPIYDFPELIEGSKDLFLILKSKNKRVCILSNGTIQMLENGVAKTEIGELIDQIFSVDEIGIYKPNPQVYQMALDRLNVEIEKVVFFSSNQWDVSGASIFGLDCVWVNQYGETKEVLPFGNVLEVSSLKEVNLSF